MPENTANPLKRKREHVTTLSIRFTDEEIAAIDAEVARRQAREPAFEITRSSVVRHAMRTGLGLQQDKEVAHAE